MNEWTPLMDKFPFSLFNPFPYPILLTTQTIFFITIKKMAFSSSSCFFTSPNFPLNQHPSTSSNFHSPRNSATCATATSDRRISTSSSLYEVLGIQIGADTVEVKAAYRRLARVLHPDVRNHDSSADEFMKVHSAYVTLSDPGKRADYDRSLFGRQKISSSPVGYSGRRWETDQCW
ncbi:hypothetical protein L6452_13854 [Arctium lappa]|uniref:Uncharacterized protein n=1 Tax=Arctium lappa TaxID=4217 RepID=A0ACB9CJC6_ARCLA|nr:hypothetical protein L6452_13854 [Arctium lappa]